MNTKDNTTKNKNKKSLQELRDHYWGKTDAEKWAKVFSFEPGGRHATNA